MPTTALRTSLQALSAVVETPEAQRRAGPALGSWRWTLRQRIGAVREALLEETGPHPEGDDWLAARGGVAFRERNVLLGRLGELGTRVLDSPDVGALRAELARLVGDIGQHVRKLDELEPGD